MTVRSAFLALLLSGLPLYAQRLPTNVHPEHYKLELAPYLQQAAFEGSETIDVTLDAPSTSVTLNAIELKIRKVEAVTPSGTQSAAITFDEAKEQATFTFPQPLPAGHVALAIQFSGILNDKLRGFYLSTVKTRSYAVTQFESTDARRAFPSFDEPAMKATFDVSLTIDKNDTAISNGPIVSDRPAAAPGKHTLVFGTTPRMSTYLVAFLVGDFACSRGKADGVPIRVCSTPDKVKLTRFALESAEFTLHFYDTYFGIKYPMAKLDLIAIPDFEAGAMENFGAITYRETDLLVDKRDSIDAQKRVSSVVAHEMAHQWFGDMVTMQWWDNLWLNEGFATWMQDKAANAWHPEWNFPQDVASSLDSTLNYDAVRTTHPIRVPAETPAEISELFDGISYGKAGAVLGMVENYLGPETFRQGVHNYLQAHLFGNATAEDFWNAQTANSHQPVDRIMETFVTQPGVPLLSFRDKEPAGYPVSQRRFYLSPQTSDQVTASSLAPGWTIPVCLKSSAAPVCTLLTPSSAVLTPPPGASSSLFYANAGGKGFFRTDYTPAQLKAILADAKSTLTPAERLGLLGDRWALTHSGQYPVGDVLDLAFSLKADPDASVLTSVLAKLDAIRSRIANPEQRTQLDAVIRTQFGPVYAALGSPSHKESYSKQEIRTRLFAALGHAGDPAILAEARRLTNATDKRSKASPLADPAITVTATFGDKSFYDKLLALSQNASSDPGLQTQALFTLDNFQDPALVTRTLDYAVSGKVRNQDSWVLIASLLSNIATRDQAWAYVQANWDKVHAQFTTASGARIVTAVGTFCTVQQRDEVASFFATHPVEAAARTLAQSMDNINACIQLRAAQQPNLQLWLAAHPQ